MIVRTDARYILRVKRLRIEESFMAGATSLQKQRDKGVGDFSDNDKDAWSRNARSGR